MGAEQKPENSNLRRSKEWEQSRLVLSTIMISSKKGWQPIPFTSYRITSRHPG